jgi:hypothetical protein
MKKITNKSWVLKNFIAFAISYSLYSLIAHGFTGGHDYELNLMQIFAHTIALSLIGLIIGSFQYSQLSKLYNIKKTNILLVPLFFIIAFWTGYYLFGPPLDIVLGFPILGSVLWVFNKKIKDLNVKYRILAYLSYFIGAMTGGFLLTIIDKQFDIINRMQDSIALHTIMWLILAIPTAIIGGFLSGISIRKSLKNTEYNTRL